MSAKRFISPIVFLALWARYVCSAAPSLMPGDSSELAAAAASLGIAHSPGYPLFCLAGKLFTLLVPFGNPALRMNFFSGFTLALGISVLSAAWISRSYASAWVPLLLAGLSPLCVTLASSTEVFGLNVLMAALLALSVERFWEKSDPQRFLLIAFVWAVGMGNQQTLMLLVPALLWIVWVRRDFLSPEMIFFFAAVLVLGLSVYAYVLLRSRAGPLLNWEEPGTLDRFWKVVSRARYGTLQLAQGTPAPRGISSLFHQTQFFAERLYHNFGPVGVGLLAAGILMVFRESWKKNVFYAAAFLIAGPLFLFWANVSASEKTLEMLDRFLLLPLILGIYFIVRGWEFVTGWRTWARWLAPALAVFWVWPLAKSGAFEFTARGNFITQDHGRNALRTVPPSTLLIADRADETEFALCYLFTVERARPDVVFVDANAGVTPSQYGPDYYEVWGKPRLERRQRMESAEIKTRATPIYYASLDLAQLDIPRRPAGFLFAAKDDVPSREKFPYWETLIFRPAPFELSSRARHIVLTDKDFLGQYALAADNPEAAMYFLTGAERLGAAPWKLRLALWHQQHRRMPEAEKLYRELLERPVKAPMVWSNLGVLYQEEGRWDEALDCYRRAVQDDPAYAEAYYNMGVVYWRKNDWPSVIAAFQKTLELNPAHDRARRYLKEAVFRKPS